MLEYTHEFADHWFHTPNALEKHGGIIPIRIGYNKAKPNYKIGPRFIVYYSLHFVLSGHVNLRWNDEEVTLQKGDLFGFFPYKVHEYYIAPESEEPLRMFWIAAEGKQMPALIRRLGLTSNRPYVKDFFEDCFEKRLFQFANDCKQSGKRDDLTLTHHFLLLFNQLIHQSQPVKTAKSADHWIRTSLDYIGLYFTEGITVKDVADHVGIHRAHFSNIFKEKVGVRPQQYILNLLMEKAMEMVKDTSMPVTHIALSLGYSDIYSFTHSFKSYYGEPPSFYRKARLSDNS